MNPTMTGTRIEHSPLAALILEIEAKVIYGIDLAKKNGDDANVAKLRMVQQWLEQPIDEYIEMYGCGDLGDVFNILINHNQTQPRSVRQRERSAQLHDLDVAMGRGLGVHDDLPGGIEGSGL